ncbi:MAG: LuxR family transcriptional regulator [Candidimonas sp.]|nr:MAG: LuxR family transcriptional regulator [Candidimonas sp.]TAM25922.1 MAG: LuxR family transcriptional regulator [Candidimonas sp.]TAM77398.1 MAG: LuxR family transcriptional regulator [Candidimonas sp.]
MSKQAVGHRNHVDYESIFVTMPIAQMVTQDRIIKDCSHAFAAMFNTTRANTVNQSARILYPTQGDFERAGDSVMSVLAQKGSYSDCRIMRKTNDELFWVTIRGFTAHRKAPYQEALWVFTEVKARNTAADDAAAIQPKYPPPRRSLTPRERDIATLLIQNLTAKEIGRALSISHRTVELHKSRLLRKFEAMDTRALVDSLLR